MVIAILLAAVLAQTSPCAGDARATAREAAERAQALDLAGAVQLYATAAAAGCPDAEVAAIYLRGLADAIDAYRSGGSEDALRPVKTAVAALEGRGASRPGQAQIARFVLLAASAAAQSERDEMALLIDHAIRLESLQFAAGQPGAPGVTAHEIAGDLWLQVHRYEEARDAYRRAENRLGRRIRSMLGLARTAARMKDTAEACRAYADFLARWGSGAPAEPSPESEARAFVRVRCE